MTLTADAVYGTGTVTITVGADMIDVDTATAEDFLNDLEDAIRVARTDARDAAAQDADDNYRD